MRIHELIFESDVVLGKYLYHATETDNFQNMLEDGHVGRLDDGYVSMTADPEYAVMPYATDIQIILDAQKVSNMESFEKYVEDWESEPGAGDWSKADGDWESEYRVWDEVIPLSYVVAARIEKDKLTDRIAELANIQGIKLISEDGLVLRKPRPETK